MTDTNSWKEKISLKPFTENDLPFLKELYTSIREPELAMTSFTPEEKDVFIKSQFAAQHEHYCKGYKTQHFYIVYVLDKPAGRFFIDYWDNEIRIVDIALMPEYRKSGLGSYLLQDLMSRAEKLSLPVTIHVECHNPARRLYERLGFQLKGAHDEVYLLMEWDSKKFVAV